MAESSTDAKQISVQGTEKGIDVSNLQEKIDWTKVAKSGMKHVFIKATEGKSCVDPKFSENWKGAGKTGIRVNCYHYFRGETSPEEQMKNIKKNLMAAKFDPTKNILAINVEEKGNEKITPEQITKNLNVLLNLIKQDKTIGHPAMIYTSYSYWDQKVKWNLYNFSDYLLWVAHYTTKPQPTLPQPWNTWTWWQYSDKGTVNGIEGKVDMDWVKT